MSSQYKRLNPYHVNGTATTTGTAIDLTYRAPGVTIGDGKTFADYVTIYNKGSDTLQISFDSGSTYADIPNGGAFDINWRIKSIHVKAPTSTAVYNMICTAGKQFRPPY